jgi:hypothetical protein
MTLLFAAKKVIELDIMPRVRKDNQLFFVHDIFVDLTQKYMSFECPKPRSTFWVDIDNSMSHSGVEIESKFEKHYLFRIPHPSHSPDIRHLDGSGVYPE